ncbi:sulfite exporter TauE/SafE family protein [Jatrophihabitans fulvus]
MALAALGIGVVVGLTGMGGGALMTPVLVLFFGVPPLAAVSSDLVAAAVMKPVGSAVHLRNGTVRLDLVKWLCIGSVPAAFVGAWLISELHGTDGLDDAIKKALGVALIVAAAGLFGRAYMRLAERARHLDGRRPADPKGPPQVTLKPVPTVLIGVVGGVIVGMTSVGSGSLIIIALMFLYPTLRASELVGTDLLQAVPLVAAAAIGHLIFGDLEFGVTTALLVGSIPGAYIGAKLSTRLPGALIRRALAFVLLASALKLLGVGTTETCIVLVAVVVLAGPVWMLLRRAHGFPALPSRESTEQKQTATAA